MTFSIICVYNNSELLNKMLVESIKKQKFKDYELLLIDNQKKKYLSASAALNYGASISKGDFLVFVHQDVELISPDYLSLLSSLCKKNNFGIAGVAGMDIKTRKVFSCVFQGYNKEIAGTKIDSIKQIDSVDECLMVIPQKSFIGFENLGSVWHLYGPAYSLLAKSKQQDVILPPLPTYHLSPGWSFDCTYFDALVTLCNKHHDWKTIPTTMGIWKNDSFTKLRCSFKKLKIRIKSLLLRTHKHN